MLQFLASWPVLLGAAIILMALAFLIEPECQRVRTVR
jgi:hypothetical protein